MQAERHWRWGNAERTMKPKKTILVADDEPTVRRLLHDCLTNAGYKVLEAAEGAKALDHLMHQTVDLLIVDLVMPGIDGLEVIRSVKNMYPDLPMVVITGNLASVSYLEVVQFVGSERIFEKPLKMDVLLKVVGSAIGGQEPIR
jgi:CheY-like chemotaxis protein